MRPYLKKTLHKKVLVEWHKVGPEFKPQYHKKKKRNTQLAKLPILLNALGGARCRYLFTLGHLTFLLSALSAPLSAMSVSGTSLASCVFHLWASSSPWKSSVSCPSCC
jgi:hypothetical protein